MSTITPRTEPSPYEELIISSTLESVSGQEPLLEAIHRLTQEGLELRATLVEHPWTNESVKRLHAIHGELEGLWAEVRRLRAQRRVELEEALGISAWLELPADNQSLDCLVKKHTRHSAKRVPKLETMWRTVS